MASSVLQADNGIFGEKVTTPLIVTERGTALQSGGSAWHALVVEEVNARIGFANEYRICSGECTATQVDSPETVDPAGGANVTAIYDLSGLGVNLAEMVADAADNPNTSYSALTSTWVPLTAPSTPDYWFIELKRYTKIDDDRVVLQGVAWHHDNTSSAFITATPIIWVVDKRFTGAYGVWSRAIGCI